jgi:hypothetical protein
MTADLDESARRIAEAGRRDVVARLRDALGRQAAAAGIVLTPEEVDRQAAAAVVHADGVLWRRALAGAAGAQLGVALREAVNHPAVARAHELADAPPFMPRAERAGVGMEADALRVAAVHLGGIEALRAGERDLELRISAAGLDVLKRSSGAAIGRLEWAEVQSVALPRGRRGLRPRRRPAYELHVATGRGRASFELPGVTEEQLKDHLEPMLTRARGAV